MTSNRASHTGDLQVLLEEAARTPADASGARLARMVELIRPHGREGVEAAESRFHALLRLLAARPELAQALSVI
jgi:hypothetical protein